MSANGIDVFDKTLQTTNIWLDEIMEDLGPDRKTAWRVLAIVLQKLRNRLPVGLAANLGAQLPILIRGIYYDQFRPEQLPVECDTMEQFCAEVGEWLRDNRPVNPEQAVQSVFGLLSRHISEGEIGNVVQALPESIRKAWPQDARSRAKEQMRESADAQQRFSEEQGFIATDERKSDVQPASAEEERTMAGGTAGGRTR
ncbi:MAG TPA: DUF2267 domain-containing protein [Sphingomicrobium sp.]|nr:DUF2267 domain-containing protein [Sphingomicrobium sp.]